MTQFIRHHKTTVIGLLLSAVLIGCALIQPKTPSVIDPKVKVTRGQLDAEVTAFKAQIDAKVAEFNAKAKAAYADLDNQQAVFDLVADSVIGILPTISGPAGAV